MFSLFVKKNTANYYNNQKNQLLKLVDQNINTFQNILDSRNTKNIKTVTRKYNQARENNIQILRRIGELKIQFKKTIGALPVVKSIPNSVKTYITISNNKYRFTNSPKVKVFQMSKILTNLKAEKAKNTKVVTNAAAAAKVVTNAAAAKVRDNAAAAKAVSNAAAVAKARDNAAAAKVVTNAAAAASLINLKKSSASGLAQARNLRTELNNAVMNTVRQQLGTNGSGVVPPNNNTSKTNNLSGLN